MVLCERLNHDFIRVTAEVKDSKRRLDKRSSEYDAARLKHLGHRRGGGRGFPAAEAAAGRRHGGSPGCDGYRAGCSGLVPRLLRFWGPAPPAHQPPPATQPACLSLGLCRSAGHLSTWAGKSSDPDKSFADMLAAKGAADEARFEMARRFTQVGRGTSTGGLLAGVGAARCPTLCTSATHTCWCTCDHPMAQPLPRWANPRCPGAGGEPEAV